MYDNQFVRHSRGPSGLKYSFLQFWKGRIKIVNVSA